MRKNIIKKKSSGTGSRRKFIRELGGAALLTAATTAVPAAGYSSPKENTEWAGTYDWICIGSGMGGCAAAIAGSDHGLKTLMIEKSETIGGITSQSAGSLWVPMNYLMKEAGIKDSRQEALDYLTYLSGGYAVAEYGEALVDNAPRVFDYLHQKAGVEFELSGLPEFFYPAAPGSKPRGRLIGCKPFPSETLGKWRSKVRLSIYYSGLAEALEGQEHNPAITGTSARYLGPARNPSDIRLKLWRKRLGDKIDDIVKRDEERRVNGAALAAYMFRAVATRGVTVWTETSAEKLIVENGRVVGLTVQQKQKEQNLRAKRGVVLATGGSPADFVDHSASWRIAAAVGAEVYCASSLQGTADMHVPGEYFPDGTPAYRLNYENRMRHSLIVNRLGERFCNEEPYQGLSEKTNQFERLGEHRFRNIPYYFIFDQNLLDKYSFAGYPPGTTEGVDWVAQGKTVEELAEKLKIPAAKLQATVARFNENARSGKDLDFGRLPATLGPVEKPPFYGVQLVKPDPLHADIVVMANPHGQVLHYQTKKPIPGLYYIPTKIMTSPIWGLGYQGGLSLTAGATFGFLATEHAIAATI